MTRFEITILGCGSATPTTLHNPSAQYVTVNDKAFLIDCGEGTQLQMRKFKASFGKLQGVFISHLHGDHVFGLPGLISTLNLLGRNGDFYVYAHKEVEHLLNPTLNFFNKVIQYNVIHETIKDNCASILFENNSIKISTFPLKHRMPTNGFLIEEKEKPLRIKKEMIEFYKIPISEIKNIKNGADFICEDGTIINNCHLTFPSTKPRKYAYCADTAFYPEIIPYIKEVDVLYHEATFAQEDIARAHETFHSTAREAAEIAKMANVGKLVIGHFSSRYKDLSPLLDEAKEVFENTELAYEGMTITL